MLCVPIYGFKQLAFDESQLSNSELLKFDMFIYILYITIAIHLRYPILSPV
jgi:hypothetical protein